MAIDYNHAHTATMDLSTGAESDSESETAYEPLDGEASQCMYDDMGECLDDDLEHKGIEVP